MNNESEHDNERGCIVREVNAGGNTWVQCSQQAYERCKSTGEPVRELIYVDVANDLIDALEAALGWIDSVPSDTVLPMMPGFDRDEVNERIAIIKRQTNQTRKNFPH